MGESKRRKQLDDTWGKPNYSLGQEYVCQICKRRMFTFYVPYQVTVCTGCEIEQQDNVFNENDER
jgi:hypothetical protein